MLLAIRGRSRKAQIALAKRLGLEDYPNPASGCLLTDPGYSARLRDLIAHSSSITLSDLNLLRTGRQFRLSERCKAIVGRDERDNERIAAFAASDDIVLEVPDVGSPITILKGQPDSQDEERAAEITARYSDKRGDARVRVAIRRAEGEASIVVTPAPPRLCEQLRIQVDSAVGTTPSSAE
jgi:hypothetical protein